MKPVVTLPFNILWVGKFDLRKQLSIAIKTIAQLKEKDFFLHIVGSGEQCAYQSLAASLNIAEQCIWCGAISHSEVQQLMQSSDILFFTSVAEGTPHVVLEAISNRLPVLCFDCCGQGDSVNDTVGIKIPLSNPDQSIRSFAEKIEYLYHNRDVLKTMSKNCIQRQQELSWDNKVRQMLELYKRASEDFRSSCTNTPS